MRRTGVSIISGALIASMLLSLLCGFFYNVWVYDVESVILEEGDWQGRIVGAFSEEDINLIRTFANVEKAVVNEDALSEIKQSTSYLAAAAEPTEKETASKSVLSGQSIVVLDLYFYKPGRIYQDMTLMSEKFGLQKEQLIYNYQLLSMYFIRIPGDDKPRLNFPLYMAVTLIVCFSLVLVIHNSFAVSMNAKIHQLGILSSVGATPKQIRVCLLKEAAVLCTLPIIGGSLAGIGIGYALLKMMNALAVQMTGRHDMAFCYHPLILGLTILVSALTVLVSAWIPTRKLAKLTPLEAIRGAEEIQPKKKKSSPVLAMLFGVEGELAGNALKTQKKALRTSTLSLTLSFFGFTIMMCFFKLSAISTDYTYFARYQDVWDVMATVKDVKLEEFGKITEVQSAMKEQGASSCVAYQKASATAQVPASAVSDEVNALGGVEAVSQNKVSQKDISENEVSQSEVSWSEVSRSEAGRSEVSRSKSSQSKINHSLADQSVGNEEKTYLIQVLIIILDDSGFQEYCEQTGITPRLDGAIVLNRIWDSINSNFRYREYVPYVKENCDSTILQCDLPGSQSTSKNDPTAHATGNNTARIPILGYTDKEPVLREEYDDYALVHVMPLSLWKEVSGHFRQSAAVETDLYIRVLMNKEKNNLTANNPGSADGGESAVNQSETLDTECSRIEESLTQMLGQEYEIETGNRIEEKITNDSLIWGYQVVIGVFCSLLAVIGIANVFSYTMGFLRQRRRECARYLSVGMTPDGLKKMFRIEMLVIAGRPVLFTLPVTVLAVSLMIKASYLNPAEFWMQAPYAPILIFIAAIFAFVALAYRIGGRMILRDSLVEALRNDALM